MITINDEQLPNGITRIRVFRDGQRVDEYTIPTFERSRAITVAQEYHAMRDQVRSPDKAKIVFSLFHLEQVRNVTELAALVRDGIIKHHGDIVEKIEVQL